MSSPFPMPQEERSRSSADLSADDPYLWSVVREPAAVSRWLLFGSEAFQAGLLLVQRRLDLRACYLLGGILLYNAASLFVVRRAALHSRAPLALFLAVDLLLVCAGAYVTGGSRSPFLGQFYLIIFAGALFYAVPGGIATGVAATLFTLALGWSDPSGVRQDVRDLLPYFPISGALTGYVSGRWRAALHAQRAEAERERERDAQDAARRYEMELARTIQETAVVDDDGLPARLGLDVAIHRTFAQEVGGDFALILADTTLGDTIACAAQESAGSMENSAEDRLGSASEAPRTLGLVVGDVSGKGVPAALTANSITYLLPYLHPLDSVETALGRLNRDLVHRLPESAFVTLALTELTLPRKPGGGRLRVWSAGHPPAILWRARAAASEIAPDMQGGPILGIFPTWEGGVPWSMPFEPGDVLVLYSDCLIETHRTTDGALFGVDRVNALVAEHAPGEDAQTLIETLVRAVTEWGTLQDDLTILVCQYAPATPRMSSS